MRKVELNMNEEHKYMIIKKLVETNGNKNNAAIKINCSIRNINRLIETYKNKGKAGFVHGNRNRMPVNRIDQSLKDKIIKLYQEKYFDANLSHFSELLLSNEEISMSITSINTILKEENILSPKAHRKTKRKLKRKLKTEKNNTLKKREISLIEETINSLERSEAHPRRPRCAYFGELVQMDASEHRWFDGIKTHLHLAIDDATGKVLAGYFDTQETLNAYYNVLFIILRNYGVPAKFLTDNRTVFEYKRKNAPSDHEDTFTQFGYACHQLGIDIATTSIPQGKGRIERLNQTFQSRLVVKLRLNNIHSIKEANEYIKGFIKKYNQKFEVKINKSKTVFETSPNQKSINTTLAVLSQRKIDNGHCVKFKHKYYIPVKDNGKQTYFQKGTKAIVIEAFDGEQYININDNLYLLEEVVERETLSKDFDHIPEVKKKHKYIPPMSHPWKQASYQAYINKQKHRGESGANV